MGGSCGGPDFTDKSGAEWYSFRAVLKIWGKKKGLVLVWLWEKTKNKEKMLDE